VSGFKLLAADRVPGCIRIGAPQPTCAALLRRDRLLRFLNDFFKPWIAA
jgi:hypothetical protein